MITMIVKKRKFKCIECMNKRIELYNVHPMHKVFEIWPLLTLNWMRLLLPIEEHLIKVKVQGAFNIVDYCFTTIPNCNSKLVWGKVCCKSFTELKT
jgi:hypothetical protein